MDVQAMAAKIASQSARIEALAEALADALIERAQARHTAKVLLRGYPIANGVWGYPVIDGAAFDPDVALAMEAVGSWQ